MIQNLNPPKRVKLAMSTGKSQRDTYSVNTQHYKACLAAACCLILNCFQRPFRVACLFMSQIYGSEMSYFSMKLCHAMQWYCRG